jgi:hypothetical protein
MMLSIQQGDELCRQFEYFEETFKGKMELLQDISTSILGNMATLGTTIQLQVNMNMPLLLAL